MPKLSDQTRLDRRQRLVDAAWASLRERGYRDLTVDGVCAAAGVSKGAFYGYFESKQDLLIALIDEEAAALDRVATELADIDATGAERLRLFTRAILREADDPARVQVRADLWSALVADPALRDRFRETIDRRRTLVRAWIEQSIRNGDLALGESYANALASVLLALSDGLMLHHALDPDGFRWTNIRTVLDALLGGVDASGPAPAEPGEQRR